MNAPAARFKPLDFGADGLAGSLDAHGTIIALNAPHSAHGYVTLTTAEPFPEAARYDPAAVRVYRAGLAALRGFGFRPDVPILRAACDAPDSPLPVVQLETAGERWTSEICVHGGKVYQRVIAEGEAPIWSGRLMLTRCAYTQLTEGGPVPMPPLRLHIRFEAGRLLIENPNLPFAVLIEGFPSDLPGWAVESDQPVEIRVAGQAGENQLVFRCGESAKALLDTPIDTADFDAIFAAERAIWETRLRDVPADPALRRGLLYSRAVAIPHRDDVCLLTDHMLLPLSWNRDAYYLARALLAWPGNQAEGVALVRGHLAWMFRQAEQRDGFWGRCYLANGRIKDAAFQLDQQLFPVLELADYALITGDRTPLTAYRTQVEALFERLMARRMAGRLLFPTDETPADDPIALPYHFSSHVVFWRVLRRLDQARVPGDWAALANKLHQEIAASFVAEHAGRALYAYATDGAGRYHWYHDANDLPVALAPAWGFCTPDDPIWQATVDFAFSEANAGGWYAGRLGSVHTRAPWPLGDIQAWQIARIRRDFAQAAQLQARLQSIARWDGALPEAYDAETGAVVSRYWFAWPNAAYAGVALGAFDS